MSDRLKFRATFPVSYYDENGNDKDIKLTIYDVAVYSGGEIGFSAQQIETIINALELSEVEQDTMWQFINDNYATSCYEWFVCDNAIIEQCTGLSDKIGNLIYESDYVKDKDGDIYLVKWDSELVQFQATGKDNCGFETITPFMKGETETLEICGNIHEQAEQKDK